LLQLLCWGCSHPNSVGARRRGITPPDGGLETRPGDGYCALSRQPTMSRLAKRGHYISGLTPMSRGSG
jgi:hypothetical protein